MEGVGGGQVDMRYHLGTQAGRKERPKGITTPQVLVPEGFSPEESSVCLGSAGFPNNLGNKEGARAASSGKSRPVEACVVLHRGRWMEITVVAFDGDKKKGRKRRSTYCAG